MNDTAQGLLALLSKHIGKENGLTAGSIHQIMDIPMRRVRTLVSELREDGHAVCGTPETGYFIAANPEELEETCEFLRNRALNLAVTFTGAAAGFSVVQVPRSISRLIELPAGAGTRNFVLRKA